MPKHIRHKGNTYSIHETKRGLVYLKRVIKHKIKRK